MLGLPEHLETRLLNHLKKNVEQAGRGGIKLSDTRPGPPDTVAHFQSHTLDIELKVGSLHGDNHLFKCGMPGRHRVFSDYAKHADVIIFGLPRPEGKWTCAFVPLRRLGDFEAPPLISDSSGAGDSAPQPSAFMNSSTVGHVSPEIFCRVFEDYLVDLCDLDVTLRRLCLSTTDTASRASRLMPTRRQPKRTPGSTITSSDYPSPPPKRRRTK